MKKRIKPILDTILSWTVSKKLSVMIIGTVMVFLDKDIPDNWLYLALVYLGVQGVYDIIINMKKVSKESQDIYGEVIEPIDEIDLEK